MERVLSSIMKVQRYQQVSTSDEQQLNNFINILKVMKNAPDSVSNTVPAAPKAVDAAHSLAKMFYVSVVELAREWKEQNWALELSILFDPLIGVKKYSDLDLQDIMNPLNHCMNHILHRHSAIEKMHIVDRR
jgi:hypothetical protein